MNRNTGTLAYLVAACTCKYVIGTIPLNTEGSYITRLRCSACQSQNPNGSPMLPFDWLIPSGLILASCHRILFLCRFSAVEK